MGIDAEPEGKSADDERPVAILQEKVDEHYEPTDKEIRDYAEWLGMDPDEDKSFLWISRQGLKTPLPKPWQPCESANGDIFYFNPDTGESKWDHPCDDDLRDMFAKEKAKRGQTDKPAEELPSKAGNLAGKAAEKRSASSREDDSESLASLEELGEVKLGEEKDQEDQIECKENSVSNVSLEEVEKAKSKQEESLSLVSLEMEKPKEGGACCKDFGSPASIEELDLKAEGGSQSASPAKLEKPQAQHLDHSPSETSILVQELDEPQEQAEPPQEIVPEPSLTRTAPGSTLTVAEAKDEQKESKVTGQTEEAFQEQVHSISSIGDEETPPVAMEDLTGKMLPPPPSKQVKDDDLAAPDKAGLGLLGSLAPPSLAPLGPLPPLSLPSRSSDSSLGETSKGGLEDVLGSPLDLLAGLGLGTTSRPADRGVPLVPKPPNKIEDAPERPSRPPLAKPRLPPRPPVLDCPDLDGSSAPPAPMKSPAAQEVQNHQSSDKTSPGASSSPPTPQLTSILAAELRPEDEEDTKGHLSLWSQIEEEEEEAAVPASPSKTGRCGQRASSQSVGSRPDDGDAGSLEISSLSNILEQSNVQSPGAPASPCSPLDVLAAAPSAPTRSVDSSTAQMAELRRLREQLERRDRECEELRAEVKAGGETLQAPKAAQVTQMEVQEEVAPMAAAAREVQELMDSDGFRETLKASPRAAVAEEVQELMGSGGFRDTLKVSWDGVQPQPASVASATDSKPSSDESAQKRVAQLEAELSALAARVKSVESGCLQGSDKDLISKTQKGREDCTPKKEAAKEDDGLQVKALSTPRAAEARAQADAAELQRLRWELREQQEESAALERQLQDCRHAMSLEQAAHSSTKSALRESQREVQRLQSQLKFQEGDAERLAAELQRCNVELTSQSAASQQLQLQLQAREAELSQAKLTLATQHRFEPFERGRLMRENFDARATLKAATLHNLGASPSNGSSTASLREVKCLGELSAEDYGEDLPATAADAAPPRRLGSSSSAACLGTGGGLQRCSSNARLCQDMSEALKTRRRELRKQHAELEEDRKHWRTEARRIRKQSGDGTQSEALTRRRSALDARAAVLNKSIGEYRAMQRLLTSTTLRSAPAGGA
eukprot:TRINITY_DN77900_c0_g1_i1.p1 TRINITY_DN77900_c0_g1~~TRINITY_DN77900_c0_g1_i1.p1  ORF type:complete len:1136 (+),score=334.40 TRINITY_DN77900_c0_g1_i1:52-3408(+)